MIAQVSKAVMPIAGHCNIAMACYDAQMAEYSDVADSIHDELLKISNDAATRFMKLCFDVETKA